MMPQFPTELSRSCRDVRRKFSPYLDGGLSGKVRSHIATHLETCTSCSQEFAGWQLVQRAVAALGPARPPENLQSQVRDALRVEREQNHHLSAVNRFALMWRDMLAPMALRVAGGLCIAAALLGGLMGTYAPAITVMANDERMANLTAPRYLYSQVPPAPLRTRHDVPVLVEAKVNTEGRVYDYAILAGPQDEAVQRRVEQNLIASVFKPATAFGVPVLGHVVLTYTGISVRG